MVEDRDINIYAVEKTTVVPLSVCRAFLVIMCICLTNHVLLRFNKVNFFQEILTKAIFSQNGRTHRYKYLSRIKDHYSSLECMPSLFRYNLYLRDISGSFFAHMTIFCKKCLHKQLFLKMVEGWDINIYVVWKDHCSHLECMSSFFSYNVYLRDKSRSSLVQQGEFLSRNPDISNFFSKWPNAQV